MLAPVSPLPVTIKSLKYPGSLSFMQNELRLEISVRARYQRHQNVTHPDFISCTYALSHVFPGGVNLPF